MCPSRRIWRVLKFEPWGPPDERHAALDEPSPCQGLLAEERMPVALANGFRLMGNIEKLVAGHEAAYPLISGAMAQQRAVALAARQETSAELIAQGPSCTEMMPRSGTTRVYGKEPL